jgi:dihydroflavonol-4-reductase
LYDATFSLVDIDDCARGHVLAAEHGLPGERYLLSGAILTIRETVSMLTAITGRVYRARYLRPGVFPALGWSIGSAYLVAGRQPPICPEAVRVMRHGHRYDGSRATRDLGLVYTTPEETFRRTIDWFVTAGLLRLD